MTTTIDAPLTTGWETDVPAGDTMLRRYLFCWSHLAEAFADAAGGRTTWTAGFAAADMRRPGGFYNAATLLRPPDPATFDDELDAIEAIFAGGAGEVSLWSAWPTPDLRPRGWYLVGHPPLLVRPPAHVLPVPSRSHVRVREVVDAADLADWEQVAIEGYPIDELRGAPTGALADPRLLSDPRLRFWLGHEGGEPVSLGTLFTDDGIGCMALGVTCPRARHRGHWRAHAVRRIDADPGLWMTGVFSDDSRPGAEGLGFLPIVRFTLWARPRPSPPERSTT